MRDIVWTLHCERDDTTISIDASGLEGQTPSVTTGALVSTTFVFAAGDTVTESHVERYESLLPFLDVPKEDVLRYGTSATGTPWFRERYGDAFAVDSLLFGVEPGSDVIDGRGFWGLLIGFTDESTPPAGTRRVTLEWFVLDRFEAFASHSEVRSAYEDSI